MNLSRIRPGLRAVRRARWRRPLTRPRPKFFQTATQADFLKGEVENLSVDARGQLTLGPAVDLVYETAAPFVWAIAAAADGSFFIGTGNEGKVYRVGPRRQGRVFFDSAELEIHAMAPAPDGGLYVGDVARRQDLQSRSQRRGDDVLRPGQDKYIWALAVDAPRQRLRRHRRQRRHLQDRARRQGHAVLPDEVDARHRARHRQGRQPPRRHRVARQGHPRRSGRQGLRAARHAVPGNPRRCDFDDKGKLYVAALNGRPRSAVRRPSRAASRSPAGAGARRCRPCRSPRKSRRSPSSTCRNRQHRGAASRGSARRRKARVYRIIARRLVGSGVGIARGPAVRRRVRPHGAPIIATGNKGKLYRLEGDPLRPTLLTRAGAQQVTAFYKDPRGQLYFATANPGKLFRLSSERAARGTYESEPRDAQMLATWGALSWRGTVPKGGKIELATRSGNTETPDETWSAWSAGFRIGEGSPITSPKARYLQWRAVLTGKRRRSGPHVRHRGVSAAQPAADRPLDHRPSARHRVSEAVHDRRARSCRLRRSDDARPQADHRGSDTQGTSAPDARPPHLSEGAPDARLAGRRRERRRACATTCCTGAKATPNGRPFAAASTSRSSSGTRRWCRTAPYFVRVDRLRLAVESAPGPRWPANATARRSRSITRRRVSRRRRPDRRRRARRSRSTSPTPTRRCRASSTRATAECDGRRCFPKDGIADSKTERYEVVVDGAIGESGITIRASDSMNNTDTTHVGARVHCPGG